MSRPSSRVTRRRGGEARGVADGDDLVDHRRVVGRGPEVLTDPLHEVRATGAARVHGALGVGPDGADRGVLLLEVAPDPGDGAARADPADEVRDPAPRLGPDLRAGGLVLGPRVVGVVVLVRLPGAGDLAREPIGHGVVRVRMARVDRRRAHDHLGAVGPQLSDLVGRHLVGAHEDARVAAASRHDGEPDARVPAGGLDDRAAGSEPSIALGALDHGQRRSVLRGEPRVVELQLREEVAVQVPRRPIEANHGGVADQRDQVVGDVHRLAEIRHALRGDVGDGDVVVGVQHDGQAPFVQLASDRSGLVAAADDADAARDVAAQVRDQRHEGLTRGHRHGAAGPCDESVRWDGVTDHHEQVHGPTLPVRPTPGGRASAGAFAASMP